jgi:hypothetical protein
MVSFSGFADFSDLRGNYNTRGGLGNTPKNEEKPIDYLYGAIGADGASVSGQALGPHHRTTPERSEELTSILKSLSQAQPPN